MNFASVNIPSVCEQYLGGIKNRIQGTVDLIAYSNIWGEQYLLVFILSFVIELAYT
jgi:hypothetical protein